jgi:chromosome segregation ATPase
MQDDFVTETQPSYEREISAPAPPAPQPLTYTRARSSSRQPEPFRHRRAGSASDTEREPALRRKLGDLTAKHEALELRYRDLKEVAQTDSASNFEKLREAADKRAREQEGLVASLRKEVAVHQSAAAESKTLRARLAHMEAENARVAAENKRLLGENKNFATAAKASESEIKVLTAKVAASRAPSEQPASRIGGGPGAATKKGAQVSQAASEELRMSRMKEDLYSDLTGLMIHNVKTYDEEDVYDCIQTGRNGSKFSD